MILKTGNTVVRPACATDLPDLVDLAVRSFRETFESDNDPSDVDEYLSSSMSVAKFDEDLSEPNNQFLVACSSDTGKLTGYAKLRNGSCHCSVIGNTVIEIQRIYADSSVIGKGIGAALMTECISLARSLGCDVIWLGVWENNARAIQFYERWGFSIVGEQEFKLGSDIQNDLIMKKGLA